MDRSSSEYAVAELQRARARVLGILDEVTDAQLRRQWTPLLSPMVWDLGHIGNYEDLWLVQTLAGERERVTPPHLDGLYDAFQQKRSERERLPLLGPDEARRYIGSVRERSMRAIDDGLLDPARAAGDEELVRNAFVLGLIVQHEHQHAETILQARQAMGEQAPPLAGCIPSDGPAAILGDPTQTRWRAHPGGAVIIGTDDVAWAYDNERPAHRVQLAPFRIAREPVTNAQWIAYMADTQAPAPRYWERAGDGAWRVLRFGTWIDVNPSEPVQHVDWYRADAFARWAGARLPTEQEWEAAACTDASMMGGVWEWTASEFQPWPGFRIFPYAEYSAEFFGRGYRVLRGGSWASDRATLRPTFRNWDLPERYQLFAGLRLANDG